MPYRTSEKTRRKKDAKRTAMMQAAVRVFAEKGYHAATVRDIVTAANVAIGTFYFYFPDKETLFVYLYEETADFLLQSVRQAVSGQAGELGRQIAAGVQTYVNLAVYEPTVVQLLLVGGVGAVPSLTEKRLVFRRQLVRVWQRVIDKGVDAGSLPEQNSRRSAEFVAGGLDEILLSLLNVPNPEPFADAAVADMTALALRTIGYAGLEIGDEADGSASADA